MTPEKCSHRIKFTYNILLKSLILTENLAGFLNKTFRKMYVDLIVVQA